MIIGVFQTDPTAIKLAPQQAAGLLGLRDGKAITLIGSTNLGITGTGAFAQIHAVTGHNHIHSGSLFLNSRIIVGVLQGDPANFALAPQQVSHLFGFRDHDLVTNMQLPHHSIVCTGAASDVQVAVGHIHSHIAGHTDCIIRLSICFRISRRCQRHQRKGQRSNQGQT